MELKRQYIVDEDNQKIGVQLDIATFQRIENVLEDHVLGQFINSDDSEMLSVEDAKTYYSAI
jgi:hypothetical protein